MLEIWGFRFVGGYIVFLDSDDVLRSDALSKLAKLAENNAYPDIIIGNIIHWDGNSEKIIVDNAKYMQEQQNRTIFETNELYAKDGVQLPWRAYQSVYKKDFLDKYGLGFDENLIGAEDCDFYLKTIEKAGSYLLSDIPLVKYRFRRDGSIINTPSYKSIIGQLATFAKAFEKAEMFSNCELMRCYFANRYTNIIVLVNMLQDELDRKHCYEFIEDHKVILKFTSYKAKYFFAKAMWRLFGFSIGPEVLIKINRLRK